MSEADNLREELRLANRILVSEDVLDAFGHVSVRHPKDPKRFLISRHRAPDLVETSDILEYWLDGRPAAPTRLRGYSERIIHGAIYEARPDVQAVCHHHAPAFMPFAISGVQVVPVFHLGATMGATVPFWDQRDEFGDTSLLVVKQQEGRSLARALGPNWTVVMRRHGVTVAARSLRELVFRTIYGCRNAEFQIQAHLLGNVQGLSRGEVTLGDKHNTQDFPIERAWNSWVRRVAKRDVTEGNAATTSLAAPSPPEVTAPATKKSPKESPSSTSTARTGRTKPAQAITRPHARPARPNGRR